jgi:hypothetical protein
MDEFWKAVDAVDWSRPREIEFRVYYNPDTGEVLNYTNENLPGDYILVDRDTFHRHRFDMKVRDGKLISPVPPIPKLVPGEKGQGCHPHDITILSTENPIHWQIKTYEQD